MVSTNDIPDSLLLALERCELTDDQLRDLIRLEAAALGLTFDEAVERARRGALPKNATGADIELLVSLLPS